MSATKTTPATHTFSIFIGESAELSITAKMARAIEELVNKITKNVDVVQLPVDQFENMFLVRFGSNSDVLFEEVQNQIVSHIAHVSLKCEVEGKKIIMFGVWKRLKQSEVLN